MSVEPNQGQEQKKNIKVSIEPKVAKGTYSNLMITNFSSEEFVIDFALLQPALDAASINSRVILSPKNAKKLMELLNENIKNYEAKIGPINQDKSPGSISISTN